MNLTCPIEDGRFKSEVSSFICFHPSLATDFKDSFKNFSLKCGSPMGTVLISRQSDCRKCKQDLSIDPKRHMVVFYHIHLGTYVGCHATKVCRKCKMYEHYGERM